MKWEEGAFLGNGLMGAMVFAPEDEGGQALAFQLGRTDVTDHRTGVEPMLARPRLPIGRLLLHLDGKPLAQGGHDGRLALWDAEWSGTVRTEAGSVELRSYVHAEQPVLVVELAARGGETDAYFQFQPALAINERLLARPVPLGEEHLNPAPFIDDQPGPGGPVRVSVQRRKSGGEYAVAWQERSLGGGRRLLVLSIADSFPGAEARQQAAAAVRRALADGPAKLRRITPGVLAPLLPAELPVGAQPAPGELLLDPDVQAGLGDAGRPAGDRHPGPLVRAHALAGHLVEPEHPAVLLAGVHRQPAGAGRIVAGAGRSAPGQPARQRAAAPTARTGRWRWGAWAGPTPSAR